MGNQNARDSLGSIKSSIGRVKDESVANVMDVLGANDDDTIDIQDVITLAV